YALGPIFNLLLPDAFENLPVFPKAKSIVVKFRALFRLLNAFKGRYEQLFL
ncbi:hypothetical protein AVEN_273681-2-1, partial [Araneus ventricosus]